MKKKWWILIAVVVFVLAGGGVLWGVLTHKEPGFMEVCWQHGQAVYTNCEQTLPLKWSKSQLPLTYYIDFDRHHKVYVESVTGAAKSWNQEIGVEVFKRVEKREDAKVVVKWGSVSGNAGGHTSHRGDDSGPKSAEVVLVDASDVRAVYRFAMHELGHVLGLAHDDFESSVMYAVAPDQTGPYLKFILPSDHDKKLLQETLR
jgi:predicted Zn-dependent protease